MLQSLAKAKSFKKPYNLNEKRVGGYNAGLVAKVEKLEKELQKAKRLEPWRRVVKARKMNQGYVIKCFQ
ncbi:unnamed protein product [Brassica oleracea]